MLAVVGCKSAAAAAQAGHWLQEQLPSKYCDITSGVGTSRTPCGSSSVACSIECRRPHCAGWPRPLFEFTVCVVVWVLNARLVQRVGVWGNMHAGGSTEHQA